ncbi:acetyl esterase/lipase [Conyzicola lurida]|uniref:Acetyl esterase/lipase n=1 Tax=Conyzicola lurida TaxID=1172621 RepID=A0A841ATA4_9MICO|nr:alpha/beta hydrolase fold domain-containing protein [Conyzicola lurida]MBB5844629.1 acetyl esterase/lipase [Conyzicola lurida]
MNSAGPLAVIVTDEAVARTGGGVVVRRSEPVRDAAAAAAPTFVWSHGGGFFRGGLDQPESDAVARALATRGIPVVAVDYRLAPLPVVGRTSTSRVRFPLPVHDVLAVHRDIGEQAPHGIVVGGASAGACLTAAAALDGAGIAQPKGVVLAYGFFHATFPRVREIQRRVRGHRRLSHAPWALDAMNRNYATSRDGRQQSLAFAGGHDLRGYPPTLMVDADRDGMRASSELFAAELVDAGVEVERHVLPEARHAFLNRPHSTEFATTIDLIAAWCLRQRAVPSA